jgi:acetolactate synthase-1/2/3 large subunit
MVYCLKQKSADRVLPNFTGLGCGKSIAYMTVAEAVAAWLAEKEITHAFGIIGAGNLSLWEAITRKGATEIVCTHHEAAAATAAGFYQRTSGKLALCLVTTGAGSSNAITGVLAAFMDSTPLLVISGNETAVSLSGNTRVKGVQGYRSARLASEFTVYDKCADDPKHAINELQLAHSLATGRGRPGPVWIDLPRDVQIAHI